MENTHETHVLVPDGGAAAPAPVRRPGPRLVDPRWSDVPAHDPAIKGFFGLRPEQKWPAEGMTSRVVQGVTMWVYILGEQPRFQRAFCTCPECGRTMPVGRLNQHWRIHG